MTLIDLVGQRDAAGYDLLVVDAMHKANFASRLCHSCRPNCEAKYGVQPTLTVSTFFYVASMLA